MTEIAWLRLKKKGKVVRFFERIGNRVESASRRLERGFLNIVRDLGIQNGTRQYKYILRCIEWTKIAALLAVLFMFFIPLGPYFVLLRMTEHGVDQFRYLLVQMGYLENKPPPPPPVHQVGYRQRRPGFIFR